MALAPLPAAVRRDMVLDTLGNVALILGLWGGFGDAGRLHPLLEEPFVIVALCATGLLNLLHLPARLRRLRAWRQGQP